MKALQKLLAVAVALAMPALALAEEAAAPSVKVTPYGFVQLSAYFDANTFTTKDYPAQVAKAQAGGAFLMSARYSRFGVKLAVDDATNWTGAKLGGGIEFDFKAGHVPTAATANLTTGAVGTFTAPSTSWYNGLMRLRLAFVTADWKTDYGTWQVLAGQHYGLVDGLFATSLAHTADPLFWQAGNPWRRAPEVRLSYMGGKDMLGLNVAVAALSPQTADGVADQGTGNQSRMPSIEARVGIDTKFDPVTVAAGVAYETGKRRVTLVPVKDLTQSILGVDANIGSQYLDVKGEFFTQKGNGDSYNTIAPGTVTVGGVAKGAESTGYWAQAVVKPVPQLSVVFGYGTEKIKSSDAATLAATARKENTQINGGVIVNAGKFWKFGAEVTQTTTKYADNVKVDGLQTAVTTQLAF
jgi:hypothetical protein